MFSAVKVLNYIFKRFAVHTKKTFFFYIYFRNLLTFNACQESIMDSVAFSTFSCGAHNIKLNFHMEGKYDPETATFLF